jgi:ATP-dependent Clp protease ATP-binding subunit ClpA
MSGEPLDTRVLRETVRERASDSTDPLVLVGTAATVAAETAHAADALVEHYVSAARAAGLSWTVIGDRLGVSKQAARERFAHRVDISSQLGDDGATVALAPRLAACLDVANAAAAEDDSVPSTHHLLLGLLHAGLAANVLDHLAVTRDTIHAASARLFQPATITTPDGQQRRIVGDGEAGAAVLRARRMAAHRGQTEVRTEHLLFIIALDPGASARRVLNDLDVDPAHVKKELASCLPPPPRPRRRLGKGRTGRTCSFCGCANPDRPMVAGPNVWICADCVDLSSNILRAQLTGAHSR